MRRIRSLVEDKPGVVTLAVLVLSLAHFLVTQFGVIPNIWSELQAAPVAEALTLYIGVAGAASLVAGFAGVVVVFGLTASGDSQRIFRAQSGRYLRRNWSSVITVSFGAAGLAFLAAITPLINLGWLGPWLMQTAFLLLAAAAIRLVWLMRVLTETVRMDDARILDAQNVHPLPRATRRSGS